MNRPFSAAQIRALENLARLWHPTHPFVLIGAGAINCHRANPRATQDLDLVLAVSMEELPAGLDRMEGWNRHPTKEHEWHGPGDVSIDVLPAGPELLAKGRLIWRSGHEMNLAGMGHAFARQQPFRLTERTTIAVAPMEVLALLKIVSYLDRPAERQHDLQDLGLVVHEYVADDDDRRWSDEIIELQLPYERVSAFLLGSELNRFLTSDERACVSTFLRLLRDDKDPTLPRMTRLAPTAWRGSEDEVLAQFDALAQGLDGVGAPR